MPRKSQLLHLPCGSSPHPVFLRSATEAPSGLSSGRHLGCEEVSIARGSLVDTISHVPLRLPTASTAQPDQAPPQEWAATLHQLCRLARATTPAPSWWTARAAYCGNVETWTEPCSHSSVGMAQTSPEGPPAFWFQLGLAGWGEVHVEGERPSKITPGTGCFVIGSPSHHYQVPAGSPGWSFAWIRIEHPWMIASVAERMKDCGPLVTVTPNQSLSRAFFRLVRGVLQRDYRDRFEAELAMWDFVLAYERWAHEQRDSPAEKLWLLDEVRACIVAALPRAIGVDALAAEYGMSRSYFSHYFRAHTGLTPARYATKVRINEAIRMLQESRQPLKAIASACGFANANHFGKVFRRYQHITPLAYRRAAR